MQKLSHVFYMFTKNIWFAVVKFITLYWILFLLTICPLIFNFLGFSVTIMIPVPSTLVGSMQALNKFFRHAKRNAIPTAIGDTIVQILKLPFKLIKFQFLCRVPCSPRPGQPLCHPVPGAALFLPFPSHLAASRTSGGAFTLKCNWRCISYA